MAEQRVGGPGDGQDDEHRRAEEERWIARYSEEQSRSAENQTRSDKDQTASDADQSLSDLDRELSQRDQLASDRDQEAADRDQKASDRELELHPGEESRRVHEAGRVGREVGRLERDEATQVRGLTTEDRARHAARRDENARQRDETAEARDRAADQRDRDSVNLEDEIASRGASLRAALELAAETRTRAAEDRAKAAADRAQAAGDRERAANERGEVLAELERAHLDELTGALRRGAGLLALQNEMHRARRAHESLILAFVDVDSLREVNNRQGHAAGDALLCDVVSGIRSNIRVYEPIVRYGGDEFVFAISGVDFGEAERRFETLRGSFSVDRDGSGISVGLAQLRAGDNLGDLVHRADTAMLEGRGWGRDGGDGPSI